MVLDPVMLSSVFIKVIGSVAIKNQKFWEVFPSGLCQMELFSRAVFCPVRYSLEAEYPEEPSALQVLCLLYNSWEGISDAPEHPSNPGRLH